MRGCEDVVEVVEQKRVRAVGQSGCALIRRRVTDDEVGEVMRGGEQRV